MSPATEDLPAAEIAAAVEAGAVSADEVVAAALARIAARNDELGGFTDVTATRALAKAVAVDAARAKGERLGTAGGGRRSPSRTCSTSLACRRAPARKSIASCRRPRPTRRLSRAWKSAERSSSAD